MTVDEAGALVRQRFELPIPLVLDRRHRLAPTPAALGATAHVDEALARARTAPPGASLTLPVLIDGNVVRAYVLQVANRFNRKPTDAQVFLRRLKPVIVPDRPGLIVNRLALTTRSSRACARRAASASGSATAHSPRRRSAPRSAR